MVLLNKSNIKVDKNRNHKDSDTKSHFCLLECICQSSISLWQFILVKVYYDTLHFAIYYFLFGCLTWLWFSNDRWPQCFSKMLCHSWSVHLMIAVIESMALQNLLLSKPMVRAVRGDARVTTTISPY